MSNVTDQLVTVDAERCNDCGYCLHTCPQDVLEMSTASNSRGFRYAYPERPEDCTGCALCAMVCPQIAIEVRGR